MKATELMIGDWVKSRGKIEQVRVVYEGHICTDSFEDSHDCYFDAIPLTSGILEKNGFERFGTSYILREYHFGLTNPSMPDNYLDNYWLNVCGRNINIKFVYELQNALRLCKIKKEIVL